MDIVFRSKKDLWLGAVLFVAMTVAAVSVAVVVRLPGPLLPRAGMAVVWLLVIGLVAWVWFGTDYRLGERELRIRSGPFRFRVDLAAVTEMRPSNNPLSSPALSLDRVFLRTGRGALGGILVSPEPREEFLAAVAERCGLERVGGVWVRS